MKNIPIIPHLEPLIATHKMVISDVWGVIHNGMVAWSSAYNALKKVREAGLPVVLVTNAPRPSSDIITQLDRLGVPRASYDAILSSGDLTRLLIKEREGQAAYHIGPTRDLGLFTGLNITLTSLDKCDFIVCSGLFNDDVETPADYVEDLKIMLARKLPFICANPDKVVERGTRLIFCAGALADAYSDLGGEVIMAGKPYRPVYEGAVKIASALTGKNYAPADILCIGDALRTDIKGANDFGANALFTIEGIHGHEIMVNGKPDPLKLNALFERAQADASAAMTTLAW
jgi:HAD superfamily hydrolase (TIGR01459 family)